MEQSRRLGRPRSSHRDLIRSHLLHVKVSPVELDQIRCAVQDGAYRSLSDFLRAAIEALITKAGVK